MSKSLTRKKIRKITEVVENAASQSVIKTAMIGTGLFVWTGMGKSEAPDLDFISDGPILSGLLDDYELDMTKRSAGSDGPFDIEGIKVDIIYDTDHRESGLRKLCEKALELRYQHDGVWIVPPEYAAAIKLGAGRKKDISKLRSMARRGQIDRNRVMTLVINYAPKSAGATWLRTGKTI